MMQIDQSLSSFERQRKIAELITQRERVAVSDLCEQFSISVATARRDLEALAAQGKIRRVHGGAIAARQAPPELPASERAGEQLDEKRRIGRAAAELVQDGETIFLGSGTTVAEVAPHLQQRHGLTVITNSLPVLNTLAGAPGVTVVSLGGVLRRSEMSLIGHIAEQALGEVRADKVFLGIRAIDLEEGLTNDYLPETMTDRAILRSGRAVVVLADHTKCGRVSTARLAPLSAMHVLVTDAGTPVEFRDALAAHGVRVLVA